MDYAIDDLKYFLDGVRDLQGYLTALSINFNGVDVGEYLKKLKDLTSDPVDFYDMLIALRADLSMLVIKYPETESEAYPAVRVIDEIINHVRV